MQYFRCDGNKLNRTSRRQPLSLHELRDFIRRRTAAGRRRIRSAGFWFRSPRVLEEDEPTTFSGPVARLPVELDVAVPVREFRVRDLLALAPGRVIESQWAHGNDVPLAAGAVQLAQSEFEGDKAADVRLARSASLGFEPRISGRQIGDLK